MKNKVEDNGKFEIFKTTEGTDIITLGRDKIYAIIETSRGHLLVKTDEEHEKEKTIQKGKFYLVDINDDPTFQDMPHLFLQKGKKFEEMILPKGLPTDSTIRKKIILTDEKIEEHKIHTHLKNDKKKILKKEPTSEIEKKELDRMARKMKISGRSKMNKKELARAIDKAEK